MLLKLFENFIFARSKHSFASQSRKSPQQKIGRQVENRARSYLESKGLHWVESNFYSRYGEIDLIMKDHHALVFVEVRFRSSHSFGTSIETIQNQKQKRIIRTSLRYLQEHHAGNQMDCRFDVIGINQNQMTWIKNAFEVN